MFLTFDNKGINKLYMILKVVNGRHQGWEQIAEEVVQCWWVSHRPRWSVLFCWVWKLGQCPWEGNWKTKMGQPCCSVCVHQHEAFWLLDTNKGKQREPRIEQGESQSVPWKVETETREKEWGEERKWSLLGVCEGMNNE